MLLREVYEQDNKTATFAFGRMNPPTIGHMKLAETVASLPGDSFLFLSHKQAKKSDPLDFNTKVKFVESFFPNIKVGNPEVRTIIQALKHLDEQGYNNIFFVAGADRLNEFAELIHKYNGQEYNFKNINVVSSGDRNSEGSLVEAMSASKLRKAAFNGDYTTFAEGVPNPRAAKALYAAVRSGMGIEEATLSLPQRPQQPQADGKAQLRTPQPQQPQQQTAPPVTPILLKTLEKYLDKLFARLGIDVEFTRHFLDRVNDERNIRQITIQELVKLFRDTYSKYGKQIAQMGPDAQAVIKDMQTDINLPFVLNWDDRNQQLDLVAKTVMRKKNFTTPNKELRV
jgi:nicotinic acid mononucleotide adenylyltransferase